MSHRDKTQIAPPRNLTQFEFDLLVHLCSASTLEMDTLRKQLPYIKVNEKCNDCLSVGFVVDRSKCSKAEVLAVPAEADGYDLDGSPIHALIIVLEGYIDELQIYREDFENIKQLPPVNKFIRY